ncbi:hypothetical protein ACM64Y_14780 [Novispirillum sp. DQ9]|uniref:hypothetical protein n=1 Tax=Novispirillum sp. DQ9 TaxID=3398612 RepID=UPI003C7EBD5D
MTGLRPPRDGERGAAVILFVALVVAAAIAAAAALVMGRPEFAVQQNTGTGFDLTALRKAVEAHAIVANSGAVACPDTDGDGDENVTAGSCTALVGDVPWRSLGVTQRQATDAWGGAVRLIVTGADLRLVSQQGGTQTECHFILISSGANRAWDYTTDAATPPTVTVTNPADLADASDVDIAVCGKLGEDEGYNASDNSLLSSSGGNSAIENFTGTGDTAQHIAARMKTPPRADWAESDEVMYFGGSSNDPDTYDLTPSNVTKTSCSWYEEPFDFTTQVLRGYLRFQFLPGEASSIQTLGTSQGFALMVIPGDRAVSSSSCGTAASDNAFGFKGVARPKFAVEFDIYRDSYEGMNDHSGGRDNPKPEGNHVALLNPSSQDYISHGGYGNPSCQDWGTYGTGPAMNGTNGACTYPPGDANAYTPSGADPRPARHATRPANWLEDRQYTDSALGQLAAQPYQVRFEFKRRCNSDCSTCGVAVPDGTDEDTLGDGYTYLHTRVWVACDEVLEGNPNACPDFPDAFQQLDDLYDGTTDYMIDHCVPDRSFSYAEDFSTVKIGVGFSTRNSAVAFMLHRFEALSEDAP